MRSMTVTGDKIGRRANRRFKSEIRQYVARHQQRKQGRTGKDRLYPDRAMSPARGMPFHRHLRLCYPEMAIMATWVGHSDIFQAYRSVKDSNFTHIRTDTRSTFRATARPAHGSVRYRCHSTLFLPAGVGEIGLKGYNSLEGLVLIRGGSADAATVDE